MVCSILLMYSILKGNSRLFWLFLTLSQLFYLVTNCNNLQIALVNSVVFYVILLIGKHGCSYKCKTFYAATSIILYSVLIDTICFFTFQTAYSGGIFSYIISGINFNLKYVLINSVILISTRMITKILSKTPKIEVKDGQI